MSLQHRDDGHIRLFLRVLMSRVDMRTNPAERDGTLKRKEIVDATGDPR
jgi:hypothetical protein